MFLVISQKMAPLSEKEWSVGLLTRIYMRAPFCARILRDFAQQPAGRRQETLLSILVRVVQ